MQGSETARRYVDTSLFLFYDQSVVIRIAHRGLGHPPPCLRPRCGLSQGQWLGLLSEHRASRIIIFFLGNFSWGGDVLKIIVLTCICLHSIFQLASLCPVSIVAYLLIFTGKCFTACFISSLCHVGYHGLYCEEEYNECLSAPCQNGATCRDLVNSYECVCLAEYEGRMGCASRFWIVLCIFWW